ncbi:MAG: NAD(+) diphosphatase [Oscillospiraceae bacterium]|jgi:NAD+ diphosphatase|nr:NAD(+) diphosphatase [Oscillospiraceae bacterium]
MLHDISPKQYHCEYGEHAPRGDDFAIVFDGNKALLKDEGGALRFPRFSELGESGAPFRYIFSVDDERFFMPDSFAQPAAIPVPEGFAMVEAGAFRIQEPRHMAFAGVTAHMLHLWYEARKFCGRCGAANTHSETERASVCPVCGLIEYPKISPVVIVAVTDGDRLLVTKYANRPFNQYALVAGFVEIGEALEDAVRREVLEETGVRIKNPRYYKSQPWGFSSSLLNGFFCELDGDAAITLDQNELSEAVWLPRGDIPPSNSSVALTAEMMELFRTGGDAPFRT